MTLKTFTFKTAVAAVLATLSLAAAAQQFTIKDIRIEGIARTEPGTVFSHLPFRVGTRLRKARSPSVRFISRDSSAM